MLEGIVARKLSRVFIRRCVIARHLPAFENALVRGDTGNTTNSRRTVENINGQGWLEWWGRGQHVWPNTQKKIWRVNYQASFVGFIKGLIITLSDRTLDEDLCFSCGVPVVWASVIECSLGKQFLRPVPFCGSEALTVTLSIMTLEFQEIISHFLSGLN